MFDTGHVSCSYLKEPPSAIAPFVGPPAIPVCVCVCVRMCVRACEHARNCLCVCVPYLDVFNQEFQEGSSLQRPKLRELKMFAQLLLQRSHVGQSESCTLIGQTGLQELLHSIWEGTSTREKAVLSNA